MPVWAMIPNNFISQYWKENTAGAPPMSMKVKNGHSHVTSYGQQGSFLLTVTQEYLEMLQGGLSDTVPQISNAPQRFHTYFAYHGSKTLQHDLMSDAVHF